MNNTIPASIKDISNLAMLCGALRECVSNPDPTTILEIQIKMEGILDKYFPE